jgi:hypothetical protein
MDDKQRPIGTAKIHPNPIDQSMSEEKQQITAPMAMAELEIMKLEGAKSAAAKNPEIRNIALLLLAILCVTLLGQISSTLIVTSFDTTQSFFSVFLSSNGVFGIALLLIQAIAIFTLLFTRNISRAKTIILVAGIGFGALLINGIVSFTIGPAIMTSIATLVVIFLIFRKIIKVYLGL